MTGSVLFIEDDEMLANNVCEYLRHTKWEVEVEHSAEAGLKKLATMHPDILLTDYRLPGKNGLEVIAEARVIDPQVKIIMMTGEGCVQIAVDAMKAGACDYVSKPMSLAALNIVLEKAITQAKIEKKLTVLQRCQSRGTTVDTIMGESAPMQALKAKIRQVLEAERRITNAADLPSILITGETGAGKDLLARAIHFSGAYKESAFVEINCATLPAHLLEAELFGFEKGAFTDAKERKIGLAEAADGGTLFLDEIGEIDLATQAKLLTLLEEKTIRRIGGMRDRKVNIRIISATNRDLEKMVKEKLFRSDLYFRLRVISLTMPPLRTLGEDILQLARYYLKQYAQRYGKTGLHLSAEAEALMLNYCWPGNVRELRNTLEQTVLFAEDDLIEANQMTFCPWLLQDGLEGAVGKLSENSSALGVTKVSDMERDIVVKALEKTGWNVSKTAKLLDMSRDMLRYRIEKYQLVAP
ncbi:MAG: sigma-54-dependent Fis family transcriptional regulator [Gallionella sp.]|nr:sigma-54-dependent Fis family transcriptional regulator [Gallionella sp.]